MNVIETRTIKRDGYTVVISKVADEDANPIDDGDYPDDVIAAWQQNEWGYVGVIAKAYRDDVMLGESSLWGCEEGNLPGVDSYVDAFGHTLGENDGDYNVPGDAIAEAKRMMAKLMAKKDNAPRDRMRAIVSQWEDIRGRGVCEDNARVLGPIVTAMLDELRDLIRAEQDKE